MTHDTANLDKTGLDAARDIFEIELKINQLDPVDAFEAAYLATLPRAGDAVVALQTIASLVHNLPRSATADQIDTIARGALSASAPSRDAEPVAWQKNAKRLLENSLRDYAAISAKNHQNEVREFLAALSPAPEIQAGKPTYGQKLIAEAIEAHFGAWDDASDEDFDDAEDTTLRDVWEAYDAMLAGVKRP